MKIEFKTNVPHFNTREEDKILYPFGPPIFQTFVDKNFTDELITEGQKLTREKNDHNFKLAGQLKYGRSFLYDEEFTIKKEPYLISLVEKFFNGLHDQFDSDPSQNSNYKATRVILEKQTGRQEFKVGQLKLDTIWINYSQKNDFNPPHTHSGVLSFVIFCKVPQNIFSINADSNTRRAGEIIFQHGDADSPLTGTEYPVRPFEGLMLMFPASMKHYVPSYYVDEERISVSGNFCVV